MFYNNCTKFFYKNTFVNFCAIILFSKSIFDSSETKLYSILFLWERGKKILIQWPLSISSHSRFETWQKYWCTLYRSSTLNYWNLKTNIPHGHYNCLTQTERDLNCNILPFTSCLFGDVNPEFISVSALCVIVCSLDWR